MRKLPLAIALTLLLSLPFALARSQQKEGWSPFQQVEGLEMELVRAIGVGHEYIWVGTAAGLYRYDGHSSDRVLSNGVAAILTDQEGALWFAGASGLYRLTEESGTPQTIFRDVAVTSLYQTGGGSLWVGTHEGVRRFNIRTLEQLEEIAVRPEASIGPIVTTIAEDRDGRLWLGTEFAGVLSYDPSTQELQLERSAAETGAVYALLLTNRETLWLGSNKGAFRLQAGNWEQVVADRVVMTIFEDRDHNLWLGTSKGLIRLFEDVDHNLWLEISEELTPCHYEEGFIRCPDDVTYTIADGLPGDSVYALIEDPWEGGLWVGTGEGVARLSGRFWRTFTPDDGDLPSSFVSAIAPCGRGRLWVGTNRGVCRFEEDRCEEELAGLDVQSLWWDGGEEEEEGKLWIVAWEPGRQTGLFHYDGQLLTPDPQVKDVLAVARDADSRFWVSTSTGLFLYDDTLQRVDPQGNWPEQARVNNIYADGRNRIWFGTDNGLVRCTEEDRPSCDRQYLPGLNVQGIADDGDGNLWLATDEGIFLYLQEVDDTLPAAVFSMADGLPFDLVHSIYRDERGVLWFGTRGGLSRYLPGRQLPRLGFNLADERLTDDEDGIIRTYDEIDTPFELEASDFRTNPRELWYVYSLESDGAVVKQGVTQTLPLRLSGLGFRPIRGDNVYQLRVWALDRDLRTSDEASLRIVVTPRPLKEEFINLVREKPWFIPTVVFTILAVVFVVREVRRRLRHVPYHYDVELKVEQTQPDSRRITVTAVTRRARVLGLPSRISETTHDLLIDERVPEKLPLLSQRPEKLTEGDVRDLGQAMYQSLVPRQIHREMIEQVTLPNRNIRLRLRFDKAQDLATLPWELVHGGEDIGFLGQREDTALVRYVEPAQEWRSFRLRRWPRVLVVLALPDDPRVDELRLNEEKEHLEEALADLPGVEVAYLAGPRAASLVGVEAAPGDMVTALNERLKEKEGWDVIHFSSHAGRELLPWGEEGEVALWLEDTEGRYHPRDAEQLANLLEDLAAQQRPKLVVLNACRTAEAVGGLVEVFLQGGVGAVVGMQWPIKDDAAREFVKGFYVALVQHGQVDYAVSRGRSQAAQKVGEGSLDWASPVLVMQTRDGFIFEPG